MALFGWGKKSDEESALVAALKKDAEKNPRDGKTWARLFKARVSEIERFKENYIREKVLVEKTEQEIIYILEDLKYIDLEMTPDIDKFARFHHDAAIRAANAGKEKEKDNERV